jgi:hypothetical protein
MTTSLLRRWQTEQGDAYVVSLVRVIFGVFLLWSGLREWGRAFGDTYFADVFHIPIVPEVLVPGRAVFVFLAAAELGLAMLVISGRLARPSLLATAVIGLYLLLCDRLAYHNNRYALLLFALLLAFAPCDRAFVFRRQPAPAQQRRAPLWAARLAQVQMAIIYLASGGSKLLDADWREGRVIGDRLVRGTSLAIARGVPAELMDVLAHPALASGLAKLAIVTELFLAVGLFLPRTRAFALWWGVMFHLTIEVTSQVELFTWLSLAVYALFAVPTLHERAVLYDPASRWGSLAARAVARLDWLERLEIRADAGAAARGLAIVERDGTRATGLLGAARIARVIPVFFPLFVPLRVLALAFSSRSEDARTVAC